MFKVTLQDGSTVTLRSLGFKSTNPNTWWDDMRRVFRYTIRDASGNVLASGSDLRGPARCKVTCREMSETLASFIGAFAEARRYNVTEDDDDGGCNWNLFPDTLAEWAENNSDEFAQLTEFNHLGKWHMEMSHAFGNSGGPREPDRDNTYSSLKACREAFDSAVSDWDAAHAWIYPTAAWDGISYGDSLSYVFSREDENGHTTDRVRTVKA